MTDHADTIRRSLDVLHDASSPGVNARLQHGRALDALDALLAERQQAQQEIEREQNETTLWQEKYDELAATANERIDSLEAEIDKLEAGRQQAIDALRQIAAMRDLGRLTVTAPNRSMQRIAEDALVKLGEKLQ